MSITADYGASNGNRIRLWTTELQLLADETGLEISVCHFPPGIDLRRRAGRRSRWTSKWNTIEHRLFSFSSMNWRAKPLVSRQTVIDLIAATTTRTGLEVFARLDERTYPKGMVVEQGVLEALAASRPGTRSAPQTHAACAAVSARLTVPADVP